MSIARDDRIGTQVRAERKAADGNVHGAAIEWRKFRQRERGRRLAQARASRLAALLRWGGAVPSLAAMARWTLRTRPRTA